MTPRFTVVTSVFDPDPAHLAACLASVDVQTLPDWEHVVVDDASTDPRVDALLAAGAAERRRRVVRRSRNGGIVAAGNDALRAAAGAHVVLLDHDDVLAPNALERFAHAIAAAEPAVVDVLYSDHDLIRPDGRYVSPVYKPDFSPERLRNHNYITHLVAVRRELVARLGGFRAGFDGAQDHDLLLRATEGRRVVVHVPEILAHWRQSPASVASDTGNKPAAYTAGAHAVADQLARLGVAADVVPGAFDGVYRVRRRVSGEPLVSVVIPTRGATGRVWGCGRVFVHDAVASLVADDTLTSRLELVVVLDPAPPVVEAGLRRIVEARLPPERLVVVPYERPFNFPDKIATGVAAASGDYVLLLNDDTELAVPGSVDEMVGLAQQPDVGMVGAKLLYDDGTLQHGGHVYNGTIDHAFRGWPGEHPGPQRMLAVERECAGVTAAAALLRRDVFDEVGGMTADLPVNYNDVDLALRVRASGRRIVWTPHAAWYHFESRTRSHPIEDWEVERLLARWPGALSADPYGNPNLLPGRADWLERPGRSGAPPCVVLPDGGVSWA
jgi:GT2 family glycosyltransferase